MRNYTESVNYNKKREQMFTNNKSLTSITPSKTIRKNLFIYSTLDGLSNDFILNPLR